MNVFFLRHGETKAQTGEEYSLNPSLSAKGKMQSVNAGKLLKKQQLDAIYISPLKRTIETYESMGLLKTNIFFDMRLVEVMQEGGYDNILNSYQNKYGKLINENDWKTPAHKNIINFSNFLKSLQCKNILIIGHAGFFNLFMKYSINSKDISKEAAYDRYAHIENGEVVLLSTKNNKISLLG